MTTLKKPQGSRTLVGKAPAPTSAAFAFAAALFASPFLPAVRGQSYGPGSSPGRAAYRPESSWNNGPYYTAPHMNPWAPRGVVERDHIYHVAVDPPYSNQPRPRFQTFQTGEGRLYPFQQGFSPFSGYSNWYVQANSVVPDARNLASATRAYFRSSPIPPDPSYLAPQVTQALRAELNPGPAMAVAPRASAPTPAPTNTPRVIVPGRRVARRIRAGGPAVVYRPLSSSAR